MSNQPSLETLLSRFDEHRPLADRVQALEGLMAWVLLPISADFENPSQQLKLSMQSRRVSYLLRRLENDPRREAFARTVCSVLLESDAVTLFSQVGLHRRHHFFSELLERSVFRLLPRPRSDRDLADIFARLFVNPSDAHWLKGLDPQVVAQVLALISADSDYTHRLRQHLTAAMQDALVLLSSQIAAIGLSSEMRTRTHSPHIEDSAFLALSSALLQARAAGFRKGEVPEQAHETLRACQHSIKLCSLAMKDVIVHLESHGVSLHLVYQLELLERELERFETLLHLIINPPDAQRIVNFLAELVQDHLAATGLTDLLRDNIHFISRKIVERSGATGEHYITRSPREYVQMLFSAAGGGLLTVLTTVAKFFIAHLSLALFFEGFFLSLNYTLSFLVMQACHFTLATKQPAMTAPALAGRLRELKTTDQLSDFVEEVARIVRSQLAAAVGNLGLVIPGAMLFDALYESLTLHHVLNAEYAAKTLASLHIFRSWTIPCAALTGVILWLGSITAGWVENWAVYHRLADGISQSRALHFFLGVRRTEDVSRWFMRSISGVAGNVTLGFLLGFTPVFGRFFGLPIDVRHVTLSTGALAFSISSLGLQNVDNLQLAFAILGIVFIGLLNFGVSFALALIVAMRARRINTIWLSHLGASLWAHFRVRPLDFFFPIQRP